MYTRSLPPGAVAPSKRPSDHQPADPSSPPPPRPSVEGAVDVAAPARRCCRNDESEKEAHPYTLPPSPPPHNPLGVAAAPPKRMRLVCVSIDRGCGWSALSEREERDIDSTVHPACCCLPRGWWKCWDKGELCWHRPRKSKQTKTNNVTCGGWVHSQLGRATYLTSPPNLYVEWPKSKRRRQPSCGRALPHAKVFIFVYPTTSSAATIPCEVFLWGLLERRGVTAPIRTPRTTA